MTRTTRFVALIASVTIAAHPSAGQCREWDDRFAFVGVDGAATAFATFDDGTGPALYAAWAHTFQSGDQTWAVSRWNGAEWALLGAGSGFGSVSALVVFDDGGGPALYAAGNFNSRVVKWNGSTWVALSSGLDGAVSALAVFDDGSGAALYAGGKGVFAVGRVAKWNGSAWTQIPSGMDAGVSALAVFDDGQGGGPALYAGGDFVVVNGISAPHIAKWNGTTWSPVPGGIDNGVRAFAVHDDGSGGGNALYAAGDFVTIGGSAYGRIARWNGANWSALGTGVNGKVATLRSHDDGSGSALYVGGGFTAASSTPASHVAKWDGSSWSAMSSGMNGDVLAFGAFDAGAGTRLFAGGSFIAADGEAVNGIAIWDEAAWMPTGSGQGVAPGIRALGVHDDGSGPALYAGGTFRSAGRAAANFVARWNGSEWSPLGGGISGNNWAVKVFASYDDGSGPALYVGGQFLGPVGITSRNIAKWDGASWSGLAGGTTGGISPSEVLALTVFDDGAGDGTTLFVGGNFTSAGGMSAPYIAKWNGSSWIPVPGGLNASVRAFAVFDDGTGPALYAAGSFSVIGGFAYGHIARWDGFNWFALGSGLNGVVESLVVFDDGSGTKLYAGGDFVTAGGNPAAGVARWDGTSWSSAGTGSDDVVDALAVFDDGSGPALYAGGWFPDLDASGRRFARRNGSVWAPVGTGLNAEPVALAVYDDGRDGAPDLYCGGSFSKAGSTSTQSIAEWHGCEPGAPYCFGDGVDPVVTAQCPCGNLGDAGHGCANSNASLGGARLWASGSTSPNTLVLHCEGIPNNALGTFMRGTMNTATGLVMGDGVQCATGTIIRFGQQPAGQNGNPSNTIAVGAATVAPGLTRYYQVQYRNPNAGFCPPEIFNFSNGYVVSW